MSDIERPALEGTVAVRDGRRLSFAGTARPRGRDHLDARDPRCARRQSTRGGRYAGEHGLRIIGVDRPGLGSSTPHLYDRIGDWTGDLELLLDALAIDTCRLIGLSGGGPYVLAAGANLPERVHGVGVLGGVVPTRGPDAAEGGAHPARGPAGAAAPGRAGAAWASRSPAGSGWCARWPGPPWTSMPRCSRRATRTCCHGPEFKAMFLDDLLNGSRFQTSAPLNDLLLFTRDWGFAAADIAVPVRWWHGDDDHIVPYRHGRHLVARLPDATMTTIDGESHLGGLGIAEEVLSTIMELGPRRGRSRAGLRAGPSPAPDWTTGISGRTAGAQASHASQWPHNYIAVVRVLHVLLVRVEPAGEGVARAEDKEK